MKRVVSLSLAFLLVCAAFCAPGLASKTVNVLVGDTVDIWVSIFNGGTAVLTTGAGSPPPTQSRIVLSHGGSDAFHVKITDVGIFRYTLSVEPDDRNLAFDKTVYDVEIYAMYVDDAIQAYIVMYNHVTGEKYTPAETYDPVTGTYTHRLSVSFSNYSSGTAASRSSGRHNSLPDNPPPSVTADPSPDGPFGPPDDSFSPPDNQEAPPDNSLFTPGSPETPPDNSLITPGGPETPPDNSLSPPGGPKSPPGSSLSPPDESGSPQGSSFSTPNNTESPLNRSDSWDQPPAQRTPTTNSCSVQQPRTGDDSRLIWYLFLAVFSAAGLFSVCVVWYISVRRSHPSDSE